MKAAFLRMSLRASILVSVMTFVPACGSDASAQTKLTPTLAALEPDIFCIDTSADQKEAIACLAKSGVSGDYELLHEPKTADDFRRQTLLLWASVVQLNKAHLTPELFDSAIDYAACVERATSALRGLEAGAQPQLAQYTGREKAEAACDDQYLSTASLAGRYKGDVSAVPKEEYKAYMLAGLLTSAVFHYTVEANGWVTDEMRPCLRYSDGRPPSIGCVSLKYQKPPPAPPAINIPDRN